MARQMPPGEPVGLGPAEGLERPAWHAESSTEEGLGAGERELQSRSGAVRAARREMPWARGRWAEQAAARFDGGQCIHSIRQHQHLLAQRMGAVPQRPLLSPLHQVMVVGVQVGAEAALGRNQVTAVRHGGQHRP